MNEIMEEYGSMLIGEMCIRDSYIDKNAEPYEGKGTPEKPYRFLCTQECYRCV